MSGSRVYDPSKLHLKKELTQIRKAARVLRDPGTSSSWKSPLSSARSVALYENPPLLVAHLQDDPQNGRKESKKKRVFLYNWSTSLPRADVDGDDPNNGFDGSSIPGSVDHSLSEIRNVDKGEGVAGDGGGSGLGRGPKESRCRDARLIRAMGKIKSCKNHSSLVQKKSRKRLQQVGFDRNGLNPELATRNAAPSSSLGLSVDDSASLIDRFGDTEEYYNSEDPESFSAESLLLSRLRQKKFSSMLYKDSQRGDSSCTYSTPALSMSSFKRYLNGKFPNTAGSWDGTSVSFSELKDEEDEMDLLGQQGCGIPCCWSRRSTPKLKQGFGSCSSPSLPDTVRIKGSRLVHQNRNCSLSHTRKPKIVLGSVQGPLPLSNCNGGASSLGIGTSDEELSTNCGELNLEGVSRLDGRRWSSSCRSQEEDGEGEIILDNSRSLSQKYRPLFFHDLVGQNIVVQSLVSAITRGKIGPVYLFQGPRGTGKTSTAKIFAAAINCLAIEGTKPCGVCSECADFISCKNRDIVEVDGTDKKAMDSVRYLLKGLAVAPVSASSKYKVFVIEECHLLPSKTWVALLKFLEETLSRVVFIFITTDAENVPRTVLSRCQKHLFNKIKDGDILRKLQRISAEERLDAKSDALELIAMNADGSLRDAETMLEQLSFLGKRITTSLVNDLVGVVSDEKLIELLELALSSNTSETVKRARELLDSGADPLVLMSQLASLIMDIIARNQLVDGAKCIGGRSLTELELQKLKHALKLLSEAENQLRVSSERSTWFTATLLQLGSTSPEFTLSGSSRRQSSKTTDEDQSTASRGGPARAQKSDAPFPKANQDQSIHSIDTTSSCDDAVDRNMMLSQSDMDKLHDIWRQCIAQCHHEKLRHLLQTYGKLVSLSEADGLFVAYIAFGDKKIKARAERYLISITNSFEAVLRHRVEVKIVLLPDGLIPGVSSEPGKSPHSSGCKPKRKDKTVSLSNSPLLDKRSSVLAARGNEAAHCIDERRHQIPMQRIESIIREQRLETAWLQAIEKGTPRSMNRLQSKLDQALPLEGAPLYVESRADLISMDSSSHRWEDELNHEIKVLKVNNKKAVKEDQTDRRPITPSLLHQSSRAGGSLSKEYQGYESGPGGGGCNLLFYWNTRRPRRAKITQKTPVQPHEGGRLPCFGECIGSRNG